MIENPQSVHGIKRILRNFKDNDIYALAGTVTQGLLKNKLESRRGAIEVILKYSPDEESFLKRKVVTRDHLFQYLHKKGIAVSLPVTKEKLIETVIANWNSQPKAIEAAKETETQIDKRDSTKEEDNETNTLCSTVGTETEEINRMAEKFSEWFYGLMNLDEHIGIDHFYPDASLTIKLVNGEQTSIEEVTSSAEDIVKLLYNTKQQYNLYFNVNLSKEGVRGRMNPHGLVMIMACGTLHISDVVSGVFEQIFALARDPFCDNNWKIKTTQLILRSRNDVTSKPRLCDSELPQILEIQDS